MVSFYANSEALLICCAGAYAIHKPLVDTELFRPWNSGYLQLHGQPSIRGLASSNCRALGPPIQGGLRRLCKEFLEPEPFEVSITLCPFRLVQRGMDTSVWVPFQWALVGDQRSLGPLFFFKGFKRVALISYSSGGYTLTSRVKPMKLQVNRAPALRVQST